MPPRAAGAAIVSPSRFNVIRVATWNVNSVKSRLQHLLEWLREDGPEIVLLQELKCETSAFPYMEIEELGYNTAIHGEKTYNGVAILSKFPLEDITRELPGEDAYGHARYIEAVASIPGGVMRVASVYVPNGQEVGSDKYAYKLQFLDRLHAHAQRLLEFEEMLVIGGDYNIAPYDIDVHEPAAWANTVLCHPEVRRRLRAMLNGGLYDAFRLKHQAAEYSWWDYRANGFASNNGLRIDHLLLSPQAADRLQDCVIRKDIRAKEKASDHASVVAILGSAR